MTAVPVITLRVDREHEARAIQAIRLRRQQEAEREEGFRVLPWFRSRDDRGRFRSRYPTSAKDA